MKRSEETMVAICEALADGMTYKAAALSCGVSPRRFWQWISESQKNDERYLIRFMSDEPIQFSAATVASRRVHYHNVRSTLERRALVGDAEVVTFQGQVQWQVDRRTVGWTEAEREMCGYPADGLLRNERGETIPLTVQRPPPTALVLRLMEVAFRSEWTPTTNTNVQSNVNIRTFNGVQFSKPSVGRPVVPPPPPIPLEILGDVIGEVAPINATANERAGDVVTDTPPTAFDDDEDFSAPPRAPAPEPERVIRETTPQEYAPGPNPLIQPRAGRSLSPLELDLLKRVRTVPDTTDRGLK